MSRRSIAAGILNGVDPASNPSPGMDPEVLRVLDMLDRQYSQQQSMGPKGVAGIMRDQPIPEEYPDAINSVGFTFPQDIARGVIQQPFTAGEAVGEALHEPSIPNATNAAFQTSLAVAQPMKALGVLGVGYGAAAADDLGLFDTSPAYAADKKAKSKAKTYPNGFTDSDLQPIADATGTPVDVLGTMRRKDISDMLGKIGVARGTAEADAKAAQEKQRREIEATQIASAKAAYEREIGRDLRFNDTAVGRTYNQTGGFAAPLAGLIVGSAARGSVGNLTKNAGPVHNYVAPGLGGALGGVVAYNAPVAFDAYSTPRLNPAREAMMAYVREAPASDPKRQEYERLLANELLYPVENPIKTGAQQDLKDNLEQRLFWGALEGATGIFGSDLVRAGAHTMKGKPPRGGSGPKPKPGSPAAPRGGAPSGAGPQQPPRKPRSPKGPGPKGPQGPAPGSQAMSYPESSLYDAATIAAAMGRRKK